MTLREQVAQKLRFLADRIDRPGAPKLMSVATFTFEDGLGVVFREDGRGCKLWFMGDAEYERAHDEAGDVDPALMWVKPPRSRVKPTA